MPWNSRYVTYATAHDKSPEDMLKHDEEKWPGGCMCGFSLWIQVKWTEWRRLFGPPPNKDWDWTPCLEEEHAHFDAWVQREELPNDTLTAARKRVYGPV